MNTTTARLDGSPTAPLSVRSLWIGRAMSILSILSLFMDGAMKLVKPAVVVEGTVSLGYPEVLE